MLNLQTIVEDLGRICNGQVWVLVTSQEDIDAIKAVTVDDINLLIETLKPGEFTQLSLGPAA